MNKSLKIVIYVLVAFLLMVLPAMLQTHLKKMPQIIMVILGGLTLISFIIKNRIATLCLFYLILGGIFFLNIEQIVYLLCDWMDIRISIGSCDGCSASYGGLILGNMAGAVLAPVGIFFYHRNENKILLFKFYFSCIYMLIVSTIFFVYEIM